MRTSCLLIILDGWGYRSHKLPYNAIASAKTPTWDRLWKQYPHSLLSASGRAVGLPDGQMGNSEVGHLTIGAGRVIFQDFTRIEESIREKTFFKNPVFLEAIKIAKENNKTLHILGLLSDGGVHSHEKYIQAFIQLAAEQGCKKIALHAFLDGRDVLPCSASRSLKEVTEQFKRLECGSIVSFMGRFYAMDRDKRWERTQKAYELLTLGKADFYCYNMDPVEALQKAYKERAETDEFISPTLLKDPIHACVQEGDVIVFMNHRADRARQLTEAFINPHFSCFYRQKAPIPSFFVSLTQYAENLPTKIAYLPQVIKNGLGEYWSEKGFSQLRIAETEKYAHVTFFFNGGIEKPFPGEERVLIPSPSVITYDQKPQMSAEEITQYIIKVMGKQEIIVCNFANPDMVGHTGNWQATLKAIQTIDNCLAKIIEAAEDKNISIFVTADHGNAEYMWDQETGQPYTAHTTSPVPFICIEKSRKPIRLLPSGGLADVAPTLLYLMGLDIPSEMQGQCLVIA